MRMQLIYLQFCIQNAKTKMLKLFNTLGRKLEAFKPIGDTVRIYSCGPTVYDYAHIGNFRAFLFADLLRRYLKFSGYKVKHVMNITDVDDKIIKNSQKTGMKAKDLAGKYEKAFFDDIKALGIEKVEYYPRATEHINEIVEIIKKLLDNGVAYKAEDGSIYYDISKFKKYGKFSGMDISGLKKGHRIKHDEYAKDSVRDFALWKSWDKDDGDVFWNTEIGKGRPGWHIECSAMAIKYLGQPFDIHTGGVDLIFPHHQNEIAQSEALSYAHGKKFFKFANYWLHNEHLLVEGKKMSKSLGNFFTLRDLLKKGAQPKAIRLALLSAHHRQQLNFTFEMLESWANALKRLDELYLNLSEKLPNKYKETHKVPHREKTKEKYNGRSKISSNYSSKSSSKGSSNSPALSFSKKFKQAMDDDLNTSNALAAAFDYAKEQNILLSEAESTDARHGIEALNGLYYVFGIALPEIEEAPQKVKALMEEREKMRKEKKWTEGDKLRQKINELGYRLDDTPEGPKVRKL